MERCSLVNGTSLETARLLKHIFRLEDINAKKNVWLRAY